MEVPSFGELGKTARDIFTTGYHYGKSLVKFNVRAKPSEKFVMASDASANFEISKLSGLMETIYKLNATALSLKWTTEGALSLGGEFNGLLMKGVDLHSVCTYNVETAVKSVKVGSKFANERINAQCEISNNFNRNVNFLGSVVVKCKNVLLGYQGGYDTVTNNMTKNNIGLAFGYSDVDFHFRCTCIPHEYGLSMLYKVMPSLDIATNGIFARRNDMQKWILGGAAKCKIDDKSTLRFKFNSDLQLATSLSQKLNDGITLILSFNIDCANVTRGGHKVGLTLNVEA